MEIHLDIQANSTVAGRVAGTGAEPLNLVLLRADFTQLVERMTVHNHRDQAAHGCLAIWLTSLSDEWRKICIPGCDELITFEKITPPNIRCSSVPLYGSSTSYVTASFDTNVCVIAPVSLQPLAQCYLPPGTEACLAAFVSPNDPLVQRIYEEGCRRVRSRAAPDRQGSLDLLEEMLAFCRERLNLRWEGHTWDSYPPGQIVRFPYRMQVDGAGNCLDLTLLLTGCLERAAQIPLIIVVQPNARLRHALLGLWLVDHPPFFAGGVERDWQRFAWEASSEKLAVIDLQTYFGAEGAPAPFEAALEAGRRQLDGLEFLFAVDVAEARDSGRFAGRMLLPIADPELAPWYESDVSEEATEIERRFISAALTVLNGELPADARLWVTKKLLFGWIGPAQPRPGDEEPSSQNSTIERIDREIEAELRRRLEKPGETDEH